MNDLNIFLKISEIKENIYNDFLRLNNIENHLNIIEQEKISNAFNNQINNFQNNENNLKNEISNLGNENLKKINEINELQKEINDLKNLNNDLKKQINIINKKNEKLVIDLNSKEKYKDIINENNLFINKLFNIK